MIDRKIKRKIERTKLNDLLKLKCYFEELIKYIEEKIEEKRLLT